MHLLQVTQSNGVLVCSSLAPSIPAGTWRESCAPYSYSNQTGLLSACCSTSFSAAIANSFLDMNACGGFNPASDGQGVSLSQSYGAVVC